MIEDMPSATTAPPARSHWSRAWERYRSNKAAVVSLAVVALIILLALLAPVIAPYGFEETDYDSILAPTGSAGHILGTDELGRDVASRLLFSLRTDFIIALSAELTALAVALVIGLVAGYLGGRVDGMLMGVTDVMYAFPSYLFAVILVTVLGRGVLSLALAIGVASWVTQARLIRAQVLSLKVREYVEAARAMGAPGPTIAIRYILPNAVGPILVTSSFGFSAAIITAAGLGLLGLGVQPPTPELGLMISDGLRNVLFAPHTLLWPVTVFAAIVLSFTWIGDGVRDAFDVGGDR